MSEVAVQVMTEHDARRLTERIREAARNLSAAASLMSAARNVESPLPRQSLYLMQAGHGGPVKIGIAVDVETRRKQVQTGNPSRVNVIYALPGSAGREREIHKRFWAFRLEGEWFEPIPEIFDWFKIEAA